MITDRYLPIDRAAKQLGVSTRTMRRYLQKFCGLVFHNWPYERTLVAERDVQHVIDKLTGIRNYSRTRKAS